MNNNPRPINKSKPSNKRCINCAHWEKAKKVPRQRWDTRERHCEVAGHDVDYWNRCALFRWNPGKLYKEDGHGTLS